METFTSERSTVETYARSINMWCNDSGAIASKRMEAHLVGRSDTITVCGSKRFIFSGTGAKETIAGITKNSQYFRMSGSESNN